MLLINPTPIDKNTGFPSTLNFPAILRQTNVTKKCPFYISWMLPLISRSLPDHGSPYCGRGSKKVLFKIEDWVLP